MLVPQRNIQWHLDLLYPSYQILRKLNCECSLHGSCLASKKTMSAKNAHIFPLKCSWSEILFYSDDNTLQWVTEYAQHWHHWWYFLSSGRDVSSRVFGKVQNCIRISCICDIWTVQTTLSPNTKCRLCIQKWVHECNQYLESGRYHDCKCLYRVVRLFFEWDCQFVET